MNEYNLFKLITLHCFDM